MTDAQTLLALAERCEKATGPDRELDADIQEAVGREPIGWNKLLSGWQSVDLTIIQMAEPYTASLDASTSLFPDDCFYRSGHDGAGPDVTMFFCQAIIAYFDPVKSVALTEPLARVAAALRARAAILGDVA
jgi:hypothetical protein